MFEGKTKAGEDFPDAPSLAEAAAGGMRSVSVMYLADAAEYASRGFFYECGENGSNRLGVLMHPEVRTGERAKQPWPTRSHVVRGIAFGLISGIAPLISGIGRIKGPQPHGDSQRGITGCQHLRRTIAGHRRMRTAGREELIWSE